MCAPPSGHRVLRPIPPLDFSLSVAQKVEMRYMSHDSEFGNMRLPHLRGRTVGEVANEVLWTLYRPPEVGCLFKHSSGCDCLSHEERICMLCFKSLPGDRGVLLRHFSQHLPPHHAICLWCGRRYLSPPSVCLCRHKNDDRKEYFYNAKTVPDDMVPLNTLSPQALERFLDLLSKNDNVLPLPRTPDKGPQPMPPLTEIVAQIPDDIVESSLVLKEIRTRESRPPKRASLGYILN